MRRPRDGSRRFRLRDPGDDEERRVRLARPHRPRASGLVIGLLGFVAGAVYFGFLGGVAGAVVALLLWGGFGLVLDRR